METPLEEGPRHPGQSSGPAMEQVTAASVRSESSTERRQNLMASVTGEHSSRWLVVGGWWLETAGQEARPTYSQWPGMPHFFVTLLPNCKPGPIEKRTVLRPSLSRSGNR